MKSLAFVYELAGSRADERGSSAMRKASCAGPRFPPPPTSVSLRTESTSMRWELSRSPAIRWPPDRATGSTGLSAFSKPAKTQL